MSQKTSDPKQANQYDKIIRENLDVILPDLLEDLLHINAASSEELRDNIQHTKEREPDVLRRITDNSGKTFIVHIEFQVRDEKKMVLRMIEYWVMLFRKYNIPIQQYVIYLGRDIPVKMKDHIRQKRIYFRYDLIAFSQIDHQLLFKSEKPEVKMLSILADLGKEDPENVIKGITKQIIAHSGGDLEQNKYLQQFRIFSQLRNLVPEIIKSMESVSTFFKEERDPFYMRGEMKGLEKGLEKAKTDIVKNLLLSGKFTDAEITAVADVTDDFIKKLRQDIH